MIGFAPGAGEEGNRRPISCLYGCGSTGNLWKLDRQRLTDLVNRYKIMLKYISKLLRIGVIPLRKRLLYLGVALLMMWIATALGEAGLTARLEGSTLSVRWKEIGAGEGVLTVYRDDWPVSVMNILGASGGIDIYVGDSAGRYSVRLRTDGGCLSAKAEQPLTGPERSEAPVPDRTVIPEATAVPAPDEVPEPDATDNAAPTAASTVEPARTPLPTSTAAPTAIITSQPTPTPSPIATPRPTATAMAAGSERSDLAAQVVDQVNRERAAQGLSALRSDAELTRAACVRAREIAVKFSHTRPNGTS